MLKFVNFYRFQQFIVHFFARDEPITLQISQSVKDLFASLLSPEAAGYVIKNLLCTFNTFQNFIAPFSHHLRTVLAPFTRVLPVHFFVLFTQLDPFLTYVYNQKQQPLSELLLIEMISISAHNTSKTKDTNSARLPEIIGAFGLVTIYKKLRSFGSPKRHFYKMRCKDTTNI